VVRREILRRGDLGPPALNHQRHLAPRHGPGKAAAAASTTCRSYLLQGLLLMSRHNPEDDQAARAADPVAVLVLGGAHDLAG
jgi:hypothetical protein